jgi:hypothetical protein
MMDVDINLLDIKVDKTDVVSDTIQLTDRISIKLKYPQFSVVKTSSKFDNTVDMAFNMIVESVESIFDGEQFYYASESEPGEIVDFIESLNQQQFRKIEEFFENLPKLNKVVEFKCGKCGFDHKITAEGLESFFV